MRKYLFQISIVVLSAVLFMGCGKDGDPVSAKTKTELICASPWKFQSATANPGGDISNAPQLACYVDNVMTFSSNGTGTINEGATVCTTPAPATFNWSLVNNETILRLSFTLFSGGSPDFTIVSLNETNLVLSQQVTIAPLPTTMITVTFKH